MDDSSKPLSGIGVCVISNTRAGDVSQLLTGESGSAAFLLSPGSYLIDVNNKLRTMPGMSRGFRDVTLTPEGIPVISLRILALSADVQVAVVDDGGNPVPGVRVDPGSAYESVTTDERGIAHIAGVAKGLIRLRLSRTEGLSARIALPKADVYEQNVVDGPNFYKYVVHRKASLRITVAGPVGEGELLPIALTPLDGDHVGSATAHDIEFVGPEDSRVVFLEAGKWSVAARPAGTSRLFFSTPTVVVVSPDRDSEVALAPRSDADQRLYGHIFDQAGRPVANLTVAACWLDANGAIVQTKSAATSPEGGYEIAGIPGGPCHVHLMLKHLSGSSLAVPVWCKNEIYEVSIPCSPHDVTLESGYSLRGTISGSANGQLVKVSHMEYSNYHFFASIDEGRFEMTNLASGSYRISLRQGGSESVLGVVSTESATAQRLVDFSMSATK